jgi:hypothetical protein
MASKDPRLTFYPPRPIPAGEAIVVRDATGHTTQSGAKKECVGQRGFKCARGGGGANLT